MEIYFEEVNYYVIYNKRVMTEKDFTIWLDGFLNTLESKDITKKQIDIVRNKLSVVNFEKKDKSTMLENKKTLILSC